MVGGMFSGIVQGLWPLVKMFLWVLIPVGVALGVMILSFIGFFIHNRFILKRVVPSPEFEKYKKPGIFKKIFWLFPKQFMDDFFSRDPHEFREFGVHMIVGEQGSGKSTSLIQMVIELQKRYPKAKVRSNMNYAQQDDEITHWKQLVHNDNGIYGQIEILDEIQTWFSSLQSKDFPPEMLTEISQQRKQRKMIIGTAQVFSRIAKPIREQTHFVYVPITIMGCFTWVRVTKARYWDEEKQTFKRYIRNYFFIHDKEVRNAFDTYKKIEKYKNEGFQENKLRVIEK